MPGHAEGSCSGTSVFRPSADDSDSCSLYSSACTESSWRSSASLSHTLRLPDLHRPQWLGPFISLWRLLTRATQRRSLRFVPIKPPSSMNFRRTNGTVRGPAPSGSAISTSMPRRMASRDGVVTLSNPTHVDINADRAYVVIPANYTFRQKGKPVSEAGSIITLTLQRSQAGWRITGWSWAKH